MTKKSAKRYRYSFLCGRLDPVRSHISKHPLAVLKRMREDGAEVTPFDSTEQRVVGKKIVNVEYHRTDWTKCFRGCL